MKRTVFFLSLLSLLTALLLATGCSAPATPAGKATPAPILSLNSVTAKGSVVPARSARVSFGTAGMIAKVNVKEGDSVKEGDVVAELDTKDLELQVKTAQDAVDVAQKSVDQAKVPASAEEIASAQAAYDSAVAGLAQAQRGPTAEDLAILKANLDKSKAALDLAQAAYDRAGGASNPMAPMLPTSLQLQSSTLDYQIAKANYDKATKLDPTAIAQAQAAVTQAKAALDLKQKGPPAEDIAVVQSRLQQAQTGLVQAQAALAKARLTAPFDGVITALAFKAGEFAQAGAPGLTLADLTNLRVETADLDEFGAARVKVGEPVSLSVNAFSDKRLTGKVASVANQSVTLPTGDISYVVAVDLDKQDPDLRWGMTVKVEFLGENK